MNGDDNSSGGGDNEIWRYGYIVIYVAVRNAYKGITEFCNSSFISADKISTYSHV